jgi:creatinine amidohydrolase
MGTAGIHSHRIAVEVARRVGGVVLPAYFLGTETVRATEGPQSIRNLGFGEGERIVGMDFPDNPVKSLYIEEGAFAVIIREIVKLIKQDPYRLVVIVNGHGAPNHVRTLRRLAAEETASGPASPPALDSGHAERAETAFVMSAVPQSVDLNALPPIGTPLRYRDYGIVNGAAFEGHPTPDFTVPRESDPRYATSEEGAVIIARQIERLVVQVRRYLADSKGLISDPPLASEWAAEG